MSSEWMTMVRHTAGTLGFAPCADGAQGVWKAVTVSVGASEKPPLLRVKAELLEPLDLGLEVRSLRAQRALPRPTNVTGMILEQVATPAPPPMIRALGPHFSVSAHEWARAEALFDHDVAWAMRDAASWSILLSDFCASIEVAWPVPDSVPLAIRCVSRLARRIDRARRAVPPPCWGYQLHATLGEVGRCLGLEVCGCPLTLRGDVGAISVLGRCDELGVIQLSTRPKEPGTGTPARAPSPSMAPLIGELSRRGGLGFDPERIRWTSGRHVSGADLGVALETLVALTRKWFGLEDGGPYR